MKQQDFPCLNLLTSSFILHPSSFNRSGPTVSPPIFSRRAALPLIKPRDVETMLTP